MTLKLWLWCKRLFLNIILYSKVVLKHTSELAREMAANGTFVKGEIGKELHNQHTAFLESMWNQVKLKYF
jgi:uncharacterized membrane-anchored protein